MFRLLRVGSIVVLIALLSALFVACTGDDDDGSDSDDLRPITATPTAVPGLPEDIAESELIIEGGDIESDSVQVIVEQPIILTVVNRDDETYILVVEDLVTETEIAAAAETDVRFNAPNEGEFEGRLMDSGGSEVDTFFVNVEGPGGT